MNSISNQSNQPFRKVSCALFSLVIIAFCVLYSTVLFDIVSLWFSRPHSYAQGVLIFIVTLFMIAHKKINLLSQPIMPSLFWGGILTACGGFLFVAGKLTDTVTLQQISIIVTILGTILLVFGRGYFKILFLPSCYLIFLFPVFDTALGSKIILLQNVSATIAAWILDLLGFTVFRQASILQMPHITLDVAAACSGLNHIVSLTAIAIPLSYFSQQSRPAKFLLVPIAAAIGIFANGLRVAMIGVWTHFNPEANVHGPGDVFLVSFVFLFGLIALLAINHLLLRFQHQDLTNDKYTKEIAYPPQQNPTTKFSITALAMAATMILMFSGASWILNIRPVKISDNAAILPSAAGRWKAEKTPIIYEGLTAIDSDQKWFMRYKSISGEIIYAFIAYFQEQNKGHELFSYPINHLLQKSTVVKLNELQPYTNEMLLFQQMTSGTTLQGGALYLIGGRYYALRSKAKFASLLNILRNRCNNGALIVVLQPGKQSTESIAKNETFIDLTREILPHIQTSFRDQYVAQDK